MMCIGACDDVTLTFKFFLIKSFRLSSVSFFVYDISEDTVTFFSLLRFLSISFLFACVDFFEVAEEVVEDDFVLLDVSILMNEFFLSAFIPFHHC
jgi:hypothetical protein